MSTSEVTHLKTMTGNLSIGAPTVTACMMVIIVQIVDTTNKINNFSQQYYETIDNYDTCIICKYSYFSPDKFQCP